MDTTMCRIDEQDFLSNRGEPRWSITAVGLGRVKTPAPAAGVEYLGGIASRESQIMLCPYGAIPRWRIVFSTFFRCMSFYTARVMSGELVLFATFPLRSQNPTFARHRRAPLRAHERTHAVQQTAPLFDHHVGKSQQRRRRVDAKRLRDLEIARQLVSPILP
jgi:hypothetical protein